MNQQDILTLFEYNYWSNNRILTALAKITPEQYETAAQISYGSLRATLVHALGAEQIWRLRAQGNSPTTILSENDLPTIAALVETWRKEETAMRAYLATLTDSDMSKTIRYNSLKGIPYEEPLWHILAHLVNHGTQTRSEAAVALTAYGQSPGDLDLILYFRLTSKAT